MSVASTPALKLVLTDETVRLSQQPLAGLFRTSRTNITEDIKHIYGEGELVEAATCRDFRQVQIEGTRSVIARDGAKFSDDALFGGEQLYPTAQTKAANLLYLVVKDHPLRLAC